MDKGFCHLESEETTNTTDVAQVEECSFRDGHNVGLEGDGSVKNHSQVSGRGGCCYLNLTNSHAGRQRLGVMFGVKAKQFSFAIVEFQSV